MKHFSLDRFEGKFAVLEDDDQKIYRVFKSLLPKNSKEGDVFFKENKSFVFDRNETLNRRKNNFNNSKKVVY